MVEHRIEAGEAVPFRTAPNRIPFALRQAVDNQIQDMLKTGVIRPNNSSWSAPVVWFRKCLRKGSRNTCFVSITGH